MIFPHVPQVHNVQALPRSRAAPFDGDMRETTKNRTPAPVFELRCGGLHLTIQRIPGWLVAALTATTGSGLAAWITSR
jgi:hypothetical protein